MATATSSYQKPMATGYPAPSQPAAGTAYPYSAGPPYYPPPPPPSQNHFNPYYHNSGISPVRRFFRFVIVACTVFFLISGIITLIAWLVFRPKAPTFSVSSASVSNFNVSSASNASESSRFLSGDFVFTLAVRNRNKKLSVDYKSVMAIVGYGRDVISEVSLPPFSQDKRNETVLRAKFAARDQYVSEKSADGILKEKGVNGGGVRFRLRVFSRVTFWSGVWRTKKMVVRVSCNDFRILFGNSTASSSGSMVGSKSKCQVDL